MKKTAIALVLGTALVAVCWASAETMIAEVSVAPAEIVIVLDRSGSMENVEGEMEEALSGLLAKQRAFNPVVTLVQFDDEYEEVFAARPVDEVGRIDIVPRGRTALLDALGRTLQSVERRHPFGKVIFVIITDGLENASCEYQRDRIFWHVAHMQNCHRWQFVYLGANQDAIAVGADLGITDANYTFTWDATNLGSVMDTAVTLTSAYLGDPNANEVTP